MLVVEEKYDVSLNPIIELSLAPFIWSNDRIEISKQ